LEDISGVCGLVRDLTGTLENDEVLVFVERADHATAVDGDFLRGEVRALHEDAIARPGSGTVRTQVAHTDTVFEMEFARPAIVIETISDV
jgi:hypothetical protein